VHLRIKSKPPIFPTFSSAVSLVSCAFWRSLSMILSNFSPVSLRSSKILPSIFITGLPLKNYFWQSEIDFSNC
jgi:hypothetical protein